MTNLNPSFYKQNHTFFQFKSKYESLVQKIYTDKQIQNTFAARLGLLNRLNLWFFPGKKFYLVIEKACGLLYLEGENAYLGFLEGLDTQSYQQIVQQALYLAAEKKKVNFYAPVEFSIWFSHRLFFAQNRDNSSLGGNFFGEPANPDFYLSAIEDLGFEVAGKYQSFTRKNKEFESIIQQSKIKIEELKQSGFFIKEIKIGLTNFTHLHQIYQLSAQVFGHHKGFSRPNFLAFLWNNLQNKSKHVDKQLLGLFTGKNQQNKQSGEQQERKKGNQLIGFCYNFAQENHFFAKTVAINPEYQNRGLTNFFVYETHREALKYEQIHYVAVKENNQVDSMNKEQIEPEGQYFLYKKQVT